MTGENPRQVSQASSSFPSEYPSELMALLGALETLSISNNGLNMSSQKRARELCNAANARAILVFQPGDGVVFKHVLHLLFSAAASVRSGARMFLESAVQEPKDFCMDDLVKQCTQDGEYNRWMMSELSKGNPDSLRAWQVVIRLLDKIVRHSSGTPILNSLLAIAEKGFKSEELEVRRETFKAWEVLIDNFAKSESVLTNPKRIRLITRPLVANNNMNKMPLAQAKFNTWWHYIQALGINAPKNVDTVIIPFLEFCYGRSNHQEPDSKGYQMSPVKKFSSMTSQCLEAFAHVLNCPVENSTLAPLDVKGSLISYKDLVKHHSVVMNAISETMNHMDLTSKTDVSKFEKIFTAVSAMVHSLEGSSEKGSSAPVNAFLTCAHGLVSLGGRARHALALVFFVLDEVRKFPCASVLCSPSPTWSVGGLPAAEMLRLVLDPVFLTVCSVDEQSGGMRLRRQLHTSTDAFLKKACASKASALQVLEGYITALEAASTHLSQGQVVSECAPLWKLASVALRVHIDRHGQVNQLDSSLEHYLGASEKILEFPLKHLAGDANRSLWKNFTELFRQVSEQVDALVSAKPLEMQIKVCKIMEDSLSRLDPNTTINHVANYGKILGSAIIADIALSSPGDLSKSLEPIVSLFGHLAAALSRFQHDQLKDCGQAGVTICSAASALLSGAKSQSVIKMLILNLLPHLNALLDRNLLASAGKAYEDATDLMFSNAVNLLQSRFSGPANSEMVEILRPFLVTCMSHYKKNIKTRSQQMWQVTFAPSLSLSEIPAEISSILKKSLMLSSDSTVSSSSSMELDFVATATNNATGHSKMFGSFLEQKAKETTGSPASRGDQSKQEKQSPLRMFRRPSRVSLEDEATQDFVPITNSGKKRRPLTEHQKEKMSARHDDIPALYSELSRDDSQLASIPRQFMSQSSLEDESSQAALDVSAFRQSMTSLKAKKVGLEAQGNNDPEAKEEGKAADSAEAAADKAPTAVDVVSSSSQESLSVIETPHSRKRKGRTPIKNLMPTAKAVASPSRERQQQQLADGTTAPPKRKRGRPPKNRKPPEEEVVTKTTEVKVKKLSPEQDSLVKVSPVKVIQETPLVIVAAQEEEADKNDDKDPPESNEACKASRSLNYDEESVEVVQSSQQKAEEAPPRRETRKRKRETSSGLTTVDSNKAPAEEGDTQPGTQGRPRVSTSTDKENVTASSAPPSRQGRAKNKYGESPLHLAAKRGDLTKVRSLLEGSVDVNAKDNAGWTPIHEAVMSTKMQNTLPIVKLLVEAGADVNARSEEGSTVLHDASKYLSQEVVQFLLDSGADCKIRNNSGLMPVHQASASNAALFKRAGSRSPSPTKKPAMKNGGEPSNPTKEADYPSDTGARDTRDNTVSQDHSESTEDSTSQGTAKAPEGVVDQDKENNACSDDALKLASLSKDQEQENHQEENTIQESTDTSSDIPSIPSLLRSPVPDCSPFTKVVAKPLVKKSTLPLAGRGARLLEMSKAKGQSPTTDKGSSSSSSNLPIMSPKAVPDVLATPTSRQRPPWEKFQPSPSDASPSASILKKAFSEGDKEGSGGPPSKRRKVQFKEPCVSDKVEIPRTRWAAAATGTAAGGATTPTGGATAQRQKQLAGGRLPRGIPLVKSLSAQGGSEVEEESAGLYEATPPIDPLSKDFIYPSLSDCDEPLTEVLGLLANQTWQKAAEKSLLENGIAKISELSRLTPLKAQALKGLKPPDNIATIVEALKKYEKRKETKKGEQKKPLAKKPAPVVDVSTPEEEEKTMKELYERPSPSPTEEDQTSAAHETEASPAEEKSDGSSSPSKKKQDPPQVTSLQKTTELDPELPTILDAYRVKSPEKERPATATKVATESKECQATPEVAEKTVTATQTEGKVSKHVHAQASPKTSTRSAQTQAKTKEEVLEEVLAHVESMEPQMVLVVMEKCMSKVRKQF